MFYKKVQLSVYQIDEKLGTKQDRSGSGLAVVDGSNLLVGLTPVNRSEE